MTVVSDTSPLRYLVAVGRADDTATSKVVQAGFFNEEWDRPGYPLGVRLSEH